MLSKNTTIRNAKSACKKIYKQVQLREKPIQHSVIAQYINVSRKKTPIIF